MATNLRNVIIKKVKRDVKILARSSVGAKGEKGSRWYNSDGLPDSTLGVDYDFYLDDITKEYYEKISRSWVLQGRLAGIDGTDGVDGIDGTDGINGIDGKDVDHISLTGGGVGPGETAIWTLWQDAGETVSLGDITTYSGRDGQDGDGSGDMLKSIYDPFNKDGDCFSMENMVDSTNYKKMTLDERNKLLGIEDNAEKNMTASELKTAYESNADTNEFSDAEKSKLGSIEDNATADMTASEIKTVYESNSNTNEFTDAEKSKLSGIEDNATRDQHADAIDVNAGLFTKNLSSADYRVQLALQTIDQLDLGVKSDPTGVSGADIVTNMISLTQAEYDAITPNASTFYIITDA